MPGHHAGVAELADAPDLGSGGVTPVKVRVLSPALQTPGQSGYTVRLAPTPGWRNWQTRRVEVAVEVKLLGGSNPLPGISIPSGCFLLP